MQKNDVELAAALFYLLGEPVPHDSSREAQAATIKEQFSDTKQALLKVVELCGEPHTAQEFYLCAKACSWLGRQYDSMTVQFANAYLVSSGWNALPSGTKTENGIPINLSDRYQDGVLADLGGAYAGLGQFVTARSAYLKAYDLEPYNVMYAIEASNTLVQLGRALEAYDFLLLQKKNPYYKPTKYRDEFGEMNYNYFFRESLDQQIEKLNRLLKKKA